MATFTQAIGASTDDAQEQAGTTTVALANSTATAANHYIGLRYTNVTIPAGSVISAATLDIDCPSTSFDDPDVDIYCEAADSAATFSTAANDISSRAATTASTAWTATTIGTGLETTPDFAGAVQEVISRGGWASGNALAVIMKGRSASCNIRMRAIDGATGTYPTITITYTTPTGQTIKAHYYRQLAS